MSTSESRGTNDLARGWRRAVVDLFGAGVITRECRPVEPSVDGEAGQVVGSFLAGDQSGDRGQDRVQVLASAEVTR
jgi:hypothetical protein